MSLGRETRGKLLGPDPKGKAKCGKNAYERPAAVSKKKWRGILNNARQPVMHEAAELINEALGNSPSGLCDFCLALHNLEVTPAETGYQIKGLLCGSCRIRISKNHLCHHCKEWPLTIGPLGRPMRNICGKCIEETQGTETCSCGRKKWVNPFTGSVAALCKLCHRSAIQKKT